MDENEVSVQPVEAPPSEPAPEPEVTEPAPEPTLDEIKAQLAELQETHTKHADELKRVQAEAETKVRKVQNVKDAEVAAAMKRAEEAAGRNYAFQDLLQLAQAADQGDVDAADRFRQALNDPKLAEIWSWGHRASQPQAVQEAVFAAQTGLLNDIQAKLEAHPAFGKLGRDKMMEVLAAAPRDEGGPDYIIALAGALAEQIAEEKAEKLFQGKVADRDEATKAKVLEEEHRKAGGVAELRGGTATPQSLDKVRDDYAEGKIDSETYESRMKALGRRP